MLEGRIYEMMQNELDGDFSKMHVKVKFRITHTVGSDAITEFIGHEVAKDHIRRQVRRARSKVDDTVDIVTEDGFYVRLKPLVITHRTAKSSQKQEIRSRAKEIILKAGATSTWVGIQKSIMDGSLESSIKDAVSAIHPVRTVLLRKTQLIQSGVTVDDGPTLEEIRAEEESEKSTPAQEDSEEESHENDDDQEIDVEASEDVEVQEAESEEKGDDDVPDYASLKVAELKELLKAAGKPVSGKKAELIARLME